MTMVEEFESTTENVALKDAIVARIRSEGGVTFRDFMEMALYHPLLGYYNSARPRIGRAGDYVTSPETSPLFGAMIGRQIREMWQLMGSPDRFEVVEAGAGNGTLCCDLLRWTQRNQPDLYESVSYVIVERSRRLLQVQREAVEAAGVSGRARWAAELPADIDGCILTNELLDSMPVHRVAVEAGVLREVFVTWGDGQFREELRPPSTPGIAAYFEALSLLPGDSCLAEANLEAARWMESAAQSLRRGFLVTFDYGYEASELFAPWRTDGTLLCFYRHNPSADPYARIGHQDMTSHVDFTTLRHIAEEAGLTTIGLKTQSEFLVNLGMLEGIALRGGATNMEEHYARRRAVTELLDPAGLGRIKVLIQSKSIERRELRGLTGALRDA